MSAAPELRIAADPIPEPIVLVIGGQTYITEPDDPAWPIAYHAREREEQLKLAERDLRGKRALIDKLREDQKAKERREREEHPARCIVERIFDRWRAETGRTKCKLTPERFDMTAARLAEEYGEDVLTIAVVGIARRPYVIEGEVKNDYRTVMQSGEQVERYANRCPRELRREVGGRLFEVAT